jgi:hypothetical protein
MPRENLPSGVPGGNDLPEIGLYLKIAYMLLTWHKNWIGWIDWIDKKYQYSPGKFHL